MYKVDNAIIMAAGFSKRFLPISLETPKALLTVKGEVLIERQIKQLKEAKVNDIYVIVGYKAEKFEYLSKKYGVTLIENNNYQTRNNNGSIWVAKKLIRNSYICSADNYFVENVFENNVKDTYYSTVYANGYTPEWCVTEDKEGYINNVTIGGYNSWYMIGHVFWNEKFSEKFLHILRNEYDREITKPKLWEHIYIEHLDELKMSIRKYSADKIFEFDTLDELRKFDTTYIYNTNSSILKKIAQSLNALEEDINKIEPINLSENCCNFKFLCKDTAYKGIIKDDKFEII